MIKPYVYQVEKKIFDRRTRTQLQHKLRVALKCYTITSFEIIPHESIINYFEFKISYRKNRIQFSEDKIHHGSFTKEEFDELKYTVTIYVYD